MTCDQCGKEIPTGKRRRRTNKFCGQSCASRFQQLKKHGNTPRERPCRGCGVLIAVERRRLYCAYDCWVESERAAFIKAWKAGEITGGTAEAISKRIRAYLISIRGAACEICGWNEVNPVTGNTPIHLDHVDGDSSNHREDNLKLLCPNHHSLTPTYGSLNRGKSKRTYRTKWRKRE